MSRILSSLQLNSAASALGMDAQGLGLDSGGNMRRVLYGREKDKLELPCK
jgi:hypothetical protein